MTADQTTLERTPPQAVDVDSLRETLGSRFNWLVLAGYVGSIAHGTYIPSDQPMSTDDIDIMSVAIPPVQYYLSLKSYEGQEGKREKWDVVVYELKKFVRLLSKNNPNVLGFLWLRPQDYLLQNEVGERLIKNRALFSSKRAFKSFYGYARSQLLKMDRNIYQGYMGAKRKQIVDTFGYDVKHASHLIRLLVMGAEFLETGKLQVYRDRDSQIYIDIKQGKWKFHEVKKRAIELFGRLEGARDKSLLPEHPNEAKINELLVSILQGELLS